VRLRPEGGGGKRILRAARWHAERLVERSSQKTGLRSMRLERNHAASLLSSIGGVSIYVLPKAAEVGHERREQQSPLGKRVHHEGRE
jgi:hypothetical protein